MFLDSLVLVHTAVGMAAMGATTLPELAGAPTTGRWCLMTTIPSEHRPGEHQIPPGPLRLAAPVDNANGGRLLPGPATPDCCSPRRPRCRLTTPVTTGADARRRARRRRVPARPPRSTDRRRARRRRIGGAASHRLPASIASAAALTEVVLALGFRPSCSSSHSPMRCWRCDALRTPSSWSTTISPWAIRSPPPTKLDHLHVHRGER